MTADWSSWFRNHQKYYARAHAAVEESAARVTRKAAVDKESRARVALMFFAAEDLMWVYRPGELSPRLAVKPKNKPR